MTPVVLEGGGGYCQDPPPEGRPHFGVTLVVTPMGPLGLLGGPPHIAPPPLPRTHLLGDGPQRVLGGGGSGGGGVVGVPWGGSDVPPERPGSPPVSPSPPQSLPVTPSPSPAVSLLGDGVGGTGVVPIPVPKRVPKYAGGGGGGRTTGHGRPPTMGTPRCPQRPSLFWGGPDVQRHHPESSPPRRRRHRHSGWGH